jgi:hypothetical protein
MTEAFLPLLSSQRTARRQQHPLPDAHTSGPPPNRDMGGGGKALRQTAVPSTRSACARGCTHLTACRSSEVATLGSCGTRARTG